MDDTFNLEILTRDGVLLHSRPTLLELPTTDGQVGIMAGHQPLLLLLGTGSLVIHCDGIRKRYAAVGGFARIKPNGVSVTMD
jgi:F-type H+-transporting ATPase subunit epsilon